MLDCFHSYSPHSARAKGSVHLFAGSNAPCFTAGALFFRTGHLCCNQYFRFLRADCHVVYFRSNRVVPPIGLSSVVNAGCKSSLARARSPASDSSAKYCIRSTFVLIHGGLEVSNFLE